jgi:hypothetical protein
VVIHNAFYPVSLSLNAGAGIMERNQGIFQSRAWIIAGDYVIWKEPDPILKPIMVSGNFGVSAIIIGKGSILISLCAGAN